MTEATDKLVVTLDDIPDTVGREFVGDWMSVEQHKLAEFDSSTYVVDEDLGWSLEDYPDTLVQGLQTLGMIPQLLDSGYRIADKDAHGIMYGFDRVRFLSKVHVGDRFRLRGVLVEARPRNNGYVTHFDCTVEVEGRDVPAYVARLLVQWLPTERALAARRASGT